jgi:hypothetical protein
MLRDWGEGDGNTEPLTYGCDWIYAENSDNTAWDTPVMNAGADYVSAIIDSALIDSGEIDVVKTWDIKETVEFWQANPDSNFGLALIGGYGDPTMSAWIYPSDHIGQYAQPPKSASPTSGRHSPSITMTNPGGRIRFITVPVCTSSIIMTAN